MSEAPGGGPPQQERASETSDNVVALGVEALAESKPPVHRPMGRLHGAAIVGMATSALIGIGAMLAFISVSWPGNMGHYVLVVFISAVVVFMASASFAVFTAARNTYPSGHTEDH